MPTMNDVAHALFGTTMTATSADAPTATIPETSPAATTSATAAPSADSEQRDAAAAPQPTKTEAPSSSSEASKDERDDLAARHAAAARRLGNQVKELTAQLNEALTKIKALEAKQDGDSSLPSEPSPEDIAAREHFRGREIASRELAFQLYGEDVVKQRVYGITPEGKDVEGGGDFANLVKAKPWVHVEVREHPQPTIAAYRALLRQEWMDRYGEDPSQWEKLVIEKVRPKLLEELRRQLSAQPIGEAGPSLTAVRGTGSAPKPRSIEDIFYGKKG